MAKIVAATGTLFVPFDCNPVNKNNLATYRLTPLIDLPSKSTVDLLVRTFTNNKRQHGKAPTNLFGTHFDGNGNPPDHTDVKITFSVGPGHAVVNIPVSPEVVYWLPTQGDGIEPSTSTAGLHDQHSWRQRRHPRARLDHHEVRVGHHPHDPGQPERHGALRGPGHRGARHPGFEYHQYLYPVGTGGFAWPGIQRPDNRGRVSRTTPATARTLFPGINEIERLRRSAAIPEGGAISPEASSGTSGRSRTSRSEAPDRVYYDRQNFSRTTPSTCRSSTAAARRAATRSPIRRRPTCRRRGTGSACRSSAWRSTRTIRRRRCCSSKATRCSSAIASSRAARSATARSSDSSSCA